MRMRQTVEKYSLVPSFLRLPAQLFENLLSHINDHWMTLSLSTVTFVGEEEIKEELCRVIGPGEITIPFMLLSLRAIWSHWFAFFERAQKPVQDYLTQHQ